MNGYANWTVRVGLHAVDQAVKRLGCGRDQAEDILRGLLLRSEYVPRHLWWRFKHYGRLPESGEARRERMYYNNEHGVVLLVDGHPENAASRETKIITVWRSYAGERVH